MTAESSPDEDKPEEIVRSINELIPRDDSGNSPFSGFDSVPFLEEYEEFERDTREFSERLGKLMGETLSWLNEKLSGFPDIPS